jgi:hypothetical protein
LDIPSLRDVIVREYTAWQQAQVEDEGLKADFRKAGEVVVAKGSNLEQIHEEQNPDFLVGEVRPGIAKRFVRDIKTWACRYKRGEI